MIYMIIYISMPIVLLFIVVRALTPEHLINR
jgi:hypothetical protein